eukprot:GDKH01010959.1.p1 GENE.GDKH01010959.1~~GDKH01010959.1.p1  ORF type:complete len:454 (+),score=79.77 GDKH01010959.1:101-1462(+)
MKFWTPFLLASLSACSVQHNVNVSPSFMPPLDPGATDLIDWTRYSDPEYDIEGRVDYAYMARDPVDITLINKLLDEIHALAEKKSDLVSALDFHLGESHFGRLASRTSTNITAKPFRDGSVIAVSGEYKKSLFVVGLLNQLTVTASYQGNTYQRLRYAMLKYILPVVIDSLPEKKLSRRTVRVYFEEFCGEQHKQFRDVLEEVSKLKYFSELEENALLAALVDTVMCDVLAGMRKEVEFVKLLSHLKTNLPSYLKALSVLDPRPTVAKLFSSYDIKIVDCQDAVSRWTPFLHCKPQASFYIKAGTSGFSNSWARVVLSEDGLDVSSVAYVPTYVASMVANKDLDKEAYMGMKSLESFLSLESFRAEVLDTLDEALLKVQDSPVYRTFLDMEAEFDRFVERGVDDFGWSEDEDLGQENVDSSARGIPTTKGAHLDVATAAPEVGAAGSSHELEM